MSGMIFQLILVTCLTVNDIGGDFLSKTCKGGRIEFYTNMEKCQAAGLAARGQKVFSDVAMIGQLGTGEVVESHKCIGIQVQ